MTYLSALLLLLAQSCVKESVGSCPADTVLLYVDVTDAASGENITSTGAAGDVLLLLFDVDGCFSRSVVAGASDVAAGRPVSVEIPSGGALQVSAWGNAVQAETFRHPEPGCVMSATALLLASDADNGDLCPGDLFFGMTSLGSGTRAAATGRVEITGKNARLHITVRGLPEAGSYSFRVHTSNNGYDYRGLPLYGGCAMKQSGNFLSGSDFCTPAAFNVIHDGSDTPQGATCIELYDADRLVATTQGNDIPLRAGLLTNVLMDVSESGSISVSIKITPYNEIYQWEIW